MGSSVTDFANGTELNRCVSHGSIKAKEWGLRGRGAAQPLFPIAFSSCTPAGPFPQSPVFGKANPFTVGFQHFVIDLADEIRACALSFSSATTSQDAATI